MLITIPGVAPEEYPPAGKEFLKAYTAKYGEKNPDRYAVYGYESMSLLLDAIKRAGDNGDDRGRRGQAAARPPRTARACSASTRSTPTATSR